VYNEVVVRGVEKQVEEANRLKSLFDSHIMEVVREVDEEVVEKLRNSGIHHGEATVISLTHSVNATAIIDDKRARHVARTLGIRLSGTPHIIIQLVKGDAITKQEARQAIDKMIEQGWYCSAKSYSEIINAIEKA
jgi:predicted nucleic acid-binding protein